MGLNCTIIKVTHPDIDEPRYDGTFGWIDESKLYELIIEGMMEDYDIGMEDKDDFEVDTWKVDSEEIMSIIEDRVPDY